ncbi:hypothetical protein GWI33_012338 [Rhynchophorus ferrugineus]|uniref:FAM69 protein-kinase domain-containing protein n=1 Tax=Rhynchophorus ferrugineus TaxID=354439 RepID=A0A834MIS8_RHYFE|nr:hypothetical protein GWI33_012338 [Rhynchophorus ferrugineus]
MGKYSSDSDTERASSKSFKSRGKHRSSSSDSSSSRSRNKRSTKKSSRRSRSRDRYVRSRRSRSNSYTSKSKSRRSNSRDRSSRYRRSSSRDKYRRSKSRDRYRSRRSRSRSYIKEYSSKSRKRSTSSSSSSDKDKYKKELKSKNEPVTTSGVKSKYIEIIGQTSVNVDIKTLEQINEDKFEPKEFSSSKTNKLPDNIVIDLKKQTIKVPEVEQVEPDSIFHHNLFLNEETRMEKWIKELYSYRQKALQQKKDELNQLHFCDSEVINIFLHEFKDKSLANLWTILKVNPEPLMLELFKQEDNWPTPKLYGFCGRCMVVKNDGVSLNEIINIDWYYRAFIALQLLDAAEKFTFAHSLFRLYLTDISLDNVVVDKNTFLISFIDLEHVVLKRKMFMWRSVHHTEHLHTEDYAFSVSEICSEDISDHNIYSICRLILSKDAPYPMKMNGLLHSPPSSLRTIEYGN